MRPESGLAARPLFHEEDIPGLLAKIGDVLRSGRLILGRHTEELEEKFARYCGTRHAVAVSSCSATLEIAVQWARGVGGDGRVVVPTNTFVATASSVERAGCIVVLCGADAGDLCLDAGEAISLAEGATAVVVVHVAGFISRGMNRLVQACRARGVPVIEDCAHAHGAELDGRHAGALADAGCFSFYPTKILTCGVGGMLTTDRDDLAAMARSLRHHGSGESLEHVVTQGTDWLLDEVRAVLALAQLERLPGALAHRRAVAAAYDRLLPPQIERLAAAHGSNPSYYKYPVILPAHVDRDRVRAALRDRKIEAGTLYSPLVHQMPAFRHLAVSGLLSTELLLKRQICLPMHEAVDLGDCAEIVDELVAACGGRS